MHRPFVLFGLIVAALALALGGYTVAQEAATPAAEGAASDLLCATPLVGSPAAAIEGTPVAVATAPETAATPGGVEPGTPIGLFPCGTPDAASTPVTDAGAGGDTAGGAGAAVATEVTVEFVDIAFVQTTLTIPANTDVTFRFVNNGAAVHNFKIDSPEVFSGDLNPAQTVDLTVNLPAGTYEYYCTIPGHSAAGMVGALTVQ